jgi:hypothetical protein
MNSANRQPTDVERPMSPDLNTQPTDPSSSATTLWRLLRPLLLGLVLAGILWSIWRFDLVRYMSVAGMRELVDAHAPYGPLLYMAIVVAGLFTRVPMMGTLLVAVGAVLFGGLAAFAYGWLAALVATTAIFVLVRSVARGYAKRMLDAPPGGYGRSTSGLPGTALGQSLYCGSSLAWRRCSIGGLA